MEVHVPSTTMIELIQGGVKAAIKESGATSRDLLMVPIGNLKIVAGLNIRIHDEDYERHIETIKESIIENGFYTHHPLAGYAGKEGENTFIYVTGGFTRLEAAKRAIAAGCPIESLPVVLKPAGTSMIDLTIALDVDNTGKPLAPYERAIVVKRLQSYGMEEEKIAARMGISGQYTKDLLYMMGLPRALQAIITSGKSKATAVVQLARKVGPSEALKAYESEIASTPAATTPETVRVTPRAAAAAAGAASRNPVIPKKTLFSAIDYAIALPVDGIKWLALWRKGDSDAVKELAAYKAPRKPRKDAKPKPAAKPKKGAAPKDPFDTGPGPKGKSGNKPAPAAAAADDNAPL